MTLNHHFRLNSEKRFKRYSLVLFSLFVLFISSSAQAVQCKKFSNVFTNSNNGQTYIVHFADDYQLEGCQQDIIMTNIEYAALSAKAESMFTPEELKMFYTFFMALFIGVMFAHGFQSGSQWQ